MCLLTAQHNYRWCPIFPCLRCPQTPDFQNSSCYPLNNLSKHDLSYIWPVQLGLASQSLYLIIFNTVMKFPLCPDCSHFLLAPTRTDCRNRAVSRRLLLTSWQASKLLCSSSLLFSSEAGRTDHYCSPSIQHSKREMCCHHIVANNCLQWESEEFTRA